MFTDRRHAGTLLAVRLSSANLFAKMSDVVVLGLPRGGVPVAAMVADALDAPLDVLVVRKLGVPGRPELAFGAIASGGHRVLVQSVIDAEHLTTRDIDRVTHNEYDELVRRERAYRDETEAQSLEGKDVVIVDDGLATGATARVAVDAARAAGAAHVIVAAPVASTFAYNELSSHADDVVTVVTRADFTAVGQFYDNFDPTPDREVRDLLRTSLQRRTQLP